MSTPPAGIGATPGYARTETASGLYAHLSEALPDTTSPRGLTLCGRLGVRRVDGWRPELAMCKTCARKAVREGGQCE